MFGITRIKNMNIEKYIGSFPEKDVNLLKNTMVHAEKDGVIKLQFVILDVYTQINKVGIEELYLERYYIDKNEKYNDKITTYVVNQLISLYKNTLKTNENIFGAADGENYLYYITDFNKKEI